MMKKWILCIMAAMVALAMLGCGHEHEWEEATCKKPKTCKICGETEGKPADHEWIEATCTAPRTCSVCNKTEGEPLGHDWIEATCTEPKTCANCGETEGEPLGHDWTFATVDAPMTCVNCGETKGEPVRFEFPDVSFLDPAGWSTVINDRICVAEYEEPAHYYTYKFYDLEGNLLHEQSLDCRLSGSAYKGHQFCVVDDSYMVASGEYNKQSVISIYDYDFNLIFEKEIKSGKLFKNQFPDMDNGNLSGCKRIYNSETGETILYFNMVSGQEIGEEEYTRAAEENNFTPPIYSEDKYYLCDEEPAVNGYFVATADQSSWGYADEEGNEIAMYKDATAYSQNGFALVTNDGQSYDLIDGDQNVIGEGVARGTSAFLKGRDSNLFVIEQGDRYSYAIVSAD
ncbi:MAG: hypothetical protein K5649_10105 [Lachnospiraceae bacterium]|nr:hypothetical protein [Lachnospiraceae bacterium]